MDFSKRIGKLNPDAIFELDGYFVWCGTMTRDDDGLYFLYFSFWEKELGFDAWVTHSKVGYATGKDPFGKFEYGGIALDGRGHGYWDRDCIHNPSVIKHNGKYYLTYSANHTRSEDYAIGYAVSDNPLGPFEKYEGNPILHKTGAVNGTGHHSFVRSIDGSELICVYHCHCDKFNFQPRKVCIDRARFSVDDNGRDVLVIDGPTTTPQKSFGSKS